MSRILKRLYSNASPVSTASVASRFLAKSQSRTPYIQTQVLDGNQLQRLSATLTRSEFSQALPKDGTPIPACWHLVFFTPFQIEEELGRDGTDTTFSPPRPFTRRMWAGGELEWVGGEENQLKVGQKVTETTKLVSAEAKISRAGGEMMVVGVEKIFKNEHGVALIDKRYGTLQQSMIIFWARSVKNMNRAECRIGIGYFVPKSGFLKTQRQSQQRSAYLKANIPAISCKHQ